MDRRVHVREWRVQVAWRRKYGRCEVFFAPKGFGASRQAHLRSTNTSSSGRASVYGTDGSRFKPDVLTKRKPCLAAVRKRLNARPLGEPSHREARKANGVGRAVVQPGACNSSANRNPLSSTQRREWSAQPTRRDGYRREAVDKSGTPSGDNPAKGRHWRAESRPAPPSPWCSGSAADSKPAGGGSIPPGGAKPV